MPMTQCDIRDYYESCWKGMNDRATGTDSLRYAGEVEDLVLTPIYRRLVSDLHIRADGGRILDVGCGSGRWVRYFLDWYTPRLVMGVDCTQASVDLLNQWHHSSDCPLEFAVADITTPALELNHRFDLINVGNVLFHIPEPDLYANALRNLARHLAPRGAIITTEYMPRTTMRTEWMLVRSRYEFEAIAASAGLRIVDVRAFGFFVNDPMGLDGPDQGVRGYFGNVRAGIRQILESNLDGDSKRFMTTFLASIEQALLAFCRERVPDIDLPSQKLVVLTAV